MLTLTIPETQLWIEDENRIIELKSSTIQLEHSLISVKKWEQKWHVPFLGNENKTKEQIVDYIRFMTINSVDPNVYYAIEDDGKLIKQITDYIENPMTATTFTDRSPIGAAKSMKEKVTAEIIYYWMIALNIPVEFQKWHLNTLLTLIKVVNIKNQPDKKMSSADASAQRRALNAQRRAKHHSKG